MIVRPFSPKHRNDGTSSTEVQSPEQQPPDTAMDTEEPELQSKMHTAIVRPFSPANIISPSSSEVQSPPAQQETPDTAVDTGEPHQTQNKNMHYPITHPLNKNNKRCPNCNKFFRGRNHMLNHVLNKQK